MAITKETIQDRIEVLPDGQLQVRDAQIVMEDGVELSRSFHRWVADPGVDADGVKCDEIGGMLKNVKDGAWTDDIISARKEVLEDEKGQT